MTTLTQIKSGDEIWSLEDNCGGQFLAHTVDDPDEPTGITMMSVPFEILRAMIEQLDTGPIADSKQRLLSFAR